MHFAGGFAIFAVFVVVFFFAVVYSYYTRTGSAINQRPYGNPYGDAPGAKRASTLAHDAEAARSWSRGTR
jgi:hypothetical protein